MPANPYRMFRLRKPCANCPFVKGQGSLFGLSYNRLLEIFHAPSFPCHKAVDYKIDEDGNVSESMQCAGLIALHHKEGGANQITRLALAFIGYCPSHVDGSTVYDSYQQCLEEHNACKTGDEACSKS